MSALKKLKKFLKIRDFKKKNIDYSRPRGKTLKSDKKMSDFREDTKANQKLQQESKNPNKNYTTYKRVTSKNKSELSNQHQKKDVKKTKNNNKSKLKAGSARAKMIAKNEARFGKAHVDKLRQKNKDFQAMKKKKMTKAEFIKKYPNSQTAKKARGL